VISANRDSERTAVDILVYGAGVLGTLYAGRLQTAGNRVSILGRGQRLEEIPRHGLVLENVLTGVQATTPVAAVEALDAHARYDLALIIVRRDQVASVVPELADNRGIPTLLFMLNNPVGSSELIRILGRNRVLLGFPGAGGTRDGHIIRHTIISQQPTTLGEFGGKRTARLHEVVQAFRAAGLRNRLTVTVCVSRERLSLTGKRDVPLSRQHPAGYLGELTFL
jgi:2-dehydropantoate 2-reductase